MFEGPCTGKLLAAKWKQEQLVYIYIHIDYKKVVNTSKMENLG